MPLRDNTPQRAYGRARSCRCKSRQCPNGCDGRVADIPGIPRIDCCRRCGYGETTTGASARIPQSVSMRLSYVCSPVVSSLQKYSFFMDCPTIMMIFIQKNAGWDGYAFSDSHRSVLEDTALIKDNLSALFSRNGIFSYICSRKNKL